MVRVLVFIAMAFTLNAKAHEICIADDVVTAFQFVRNDLVALEAGGERFLVATERCERLPFAEMLGFQLRSNTEKVCAGDKLAVFEKASTHYLTELCRITRIAYDKSSYPF